MDLLKRATDQRQSDLVSVIIPTHNRAGLLPRAIRSVLAQTYANLECIIVDDASTDNTPQVVRQFADERLVYLRHETNRHVSAARNTGLAQAKGDFIAFLDDDDEWLPTKLEKQISLLQQALPSVGLIHCWMDYYNSKGELVKAHHPTSRGNVFARLLAAHSIGGTPTFLIRREVLETVGGFDESLPVGNDHDFACRISHHYEVDVVPEALVRVYLDHNHQRLSDTNPKVLKNRIHALLTKLDKFKAEYEQYPAAKATTYVFLAEYYDRLKDWNNSVRFYGLAFITYPFLLDIYRSLGNRSKLRLNRIKSFFGL